MKFKAIGGSWDGLMIGFEGERTERHFQAPTRRERPADARVYNSDLHAFDTLTIENYILHSMVEVRPTRNKNDGGVRNEPVGEVSFYLNSPLRNLNDTEILQLLIDQHRPADKQER